VVGLAAPTRVSSNERLHCGAPQGNGVETPILPLAGRNRYEKKQIAKSPVPDTSRQSPHRRQVRRVIRVDDAHRR